MVVKKKTTESSRRHAFTSFKERIDGIKIEPNIKLTKRPFDIEVVTSHLLTTLDHWKEINLSKIFTDFYDQIESNSQSLPQIIYHQSFIFNKLYDSIKQVDIHSMQPLLECLTQFIHDLGPDFLPYYLKTLNLLTNIVVNIDPNDLQNNRNSSNILEWTFNALAFTFKYLSRHIITDLIPTFNELLPLLKLTKKKYLSRFCSEALSFLIKKSNETSLQQVIKFSLYDQVETILENDSYCESLSILYAESMKNTNGTFHTKSNLILTTLLTNILFSLDDDKVKNKLIGILSDILLDLLNHGTNESCNKFYILITDILNDLMKNSNNLTLLTTCQILSTLSFAESGRKINDWSCILNTVNNLISNLKNLQDPSIELLESFVYLLCIVFRNCDIQLLTKNYRNYFEIIMNLNGGNEFLLFAQSSLTIVKAKVTNFGLIKYIQEYINKIDDDQLPKLAYFLRITDYRFEIPNFKLDINENTSYEEIYWKLLISSYNDKIDLDVTLLEKILFNLNSSPLHKELAGTIINILVQKNHTSNLSTFIEDSFEKFQNSANFISSINKFVIKTGDNDNLLPKVINCLYIPNHQVRLNTIELLFTILKDSPYLSQIRIIEQIPLDLSNGRDIILRIRNLALEFQKAVNVSEIDKQLVIHYLFGVLSNKFQPFWNGVFEALPIISSHATNEIIWQVAFKLLNTNEESEHFELDEFSQESDLINWQPKKHKLFNNFTQFDNNYLIPFRNIHNSIMKLCKFDLGETSYDEILKLHILQGLKTIPNAIESHTDELVPILTNQNKESWSIKERNGLLELFTKIKGLKKKTMADDLYSYLLDHLLTSTHSKTQQLALDVLFNFNNSIINKYKDNLKNLLDDTIFSDEVAIFLSSSSSISHEDKSIIMPFIIRILFGRVQGSPKSNSKQGKKFQVISVLPSLTNSDIISFIQLGANKLNYQNYFQGIVPKVSLGLDINELKKINGFINLLIEVYETLGSNYEEALIFTIEPLVYSLVSAQNCIESECNDIVMDKIARSIRTNGMKCLNELFKIVGESFNWKSYYDLIYNNLILPRLDNFANENLQQPSSLLQLITSWISNSNTVTLLYIDDFSIVRALLSILSRSKDAKESVITKILDFSIEALERKDEIDDLWFTLLALVVDSLLQNLAETIKNIYDKEVGSRAIKILLLLISGKYIDDSETKSTLIESLTIALKKNNNQIDLNDKANILISLSSLIDTYDCEFKDIEQFYTTVSKLFRFFPIRNVRETLSSVISSIGAKFEEVGKTDLIVDLNSYTIRGEFDFEKRLNAFKLINEELYNDLSPLQWLPLINNSLFFINDPEELAIRSNATYMLKRFIDCYSNKSEAEAIPYISQLKDLILPNLKIGIRKDNEDIQSEYISLLEYIVNHSKYYTELEDMKILSTDDIQIDNEDQVNNFFQNITNIQLYRRHRAIKKLIDYKSELNESSISHYILPIIEKYVTSENDKYRNLGLEALDTISALLKSVTWNQYKAILKRYVSNLKTQTHLKQKVNLIVSSSIALIQSKNENTMQLPNQDELDNFILFEMSPTLLKILNVRDDDTIVARAPLSEALTNFILCISPYKIDGELPKILTNLSQVMRSRSEELRDAVRKSLGKISILLGPIYFPFILKELKTALSRGSQIHVLSFTMHYLLTCISKILSHGDLNESVNLIIDIVMEDIFGAAGQEKDAEGYTSKMKEVKFKKSFDSTELLVSNISLNQFGELIKPIKLLLKENISYKTQLKLDELLRRISLGLNHNFESNDINILHLCYQIYQMSKEEEKVKEVKEPTEKEKHFLTTLDRKVVKAHVDKSLFKITLQKLSLELLRTAISRHEKLLTVGNLSEFVPILEESIKSDNEQVIIASIKILIIIIRLPFDENDQNVFKSCMRRSLILIKDSPSTNADICQTALKFLSTTIRHNQELNLKESAISYILTRIQPDLNEPNKQGTAFNFLKSIVSQHVMIPEVYELMDNVAKIMIVNHSKEIRDMSRSVYFQFLMEYDQGKGRLEKQFKYLVTNLSYPTEEGRQSIMELIHLIILKSGDVLLSKLATSFFVSLANVLISDMSNKCREMANALISTIFKKLKDVSQLEKFIMMWLKQSSNQLLKRCGLNVYKIYIIVLGMNNEKLNSIAKDSILHIFKAAKNEEDNDIEWELLYSALVLFNTIASIQKEKVFSKAFESFWKCIVDILLYPHSWIRLNSSRLITLLLTHLNDTKFKVSEYEIQTISVKLIHQLRAPSISEELGNQIVKNLVLIGMKWESKNQEWINDDEDGVVIANDYLLDKIGSIIKQENLQSVESKRSCIKLSAMFIQFTNDSRILKVSEMIISALYNFTDSEYSKSVEDDELIKLSTEALDLVNSKIGITEYTSIYSKIKSQVNNRRMERKAKKAQLAVNQPDIAAKRKFKKHERFREKRKHEKDENGYYKPKKKRVF
ncbi:unnamed protein product [Candida verbasci]|uniref:U3 small nucleolar RNA-associated protein 20 n=1 Tax=Candida verbasci TaxID=1227364 RepID=A0A9W4TU93_9ASCO|nr:unnamed protein product [Candida verbasci]